MQSNETSLYVLQMDYLKEILNLGLGHVAEELADLLQGEILLNVPEVDIMPNKVAVKRMGIGKDESIVAVRQSLKGDVSSDCVLIFPESESLEIVKLLLNDDSIDRVSELDEEALLDVTNIIVSGIVYTLEEMLGANIDSGFPECQRGRFSSLFSKWFPTDDYEEMGLYLSIGFKVSGSYINGRLICFQEVASLKGFLAKIAERLEAEGMLG